MITVKYLASLSETLGKQSETLAINNEPLSVVAVWTQLNPAVKMPANTVCAINFRYVPRESLVKSGDELAFFPPVTGG